jgi:hypothetical protein
LRSSTVLSNTGLIVLTRRLNASGEAPATGWRCIDAIDRIGC